MKTPAPHCKLISICASLSEHVCRTYVGSGTLAAETLDLSITINLVVLEHSQLRLLALVLDLLWGSVDLLLALLGTTTQTEDQVKSRLLLDVVVGEGAAVFELLASEDQALLVGRDTFLVLDLGLDIVDGVRRLHLEGDSLAREGLDEDLHDCLRWELEYYRRSFRDSVLNLPSCGNVELYLDKSCLPEQSVWLSKAKKVRS